MVSNCHLELQTEGLLWEGSGRGPRGAQPTGQAPCTGLSRVFSEGIGLWLPVTVLFPGQCRGLGGALTQGQPLTPGHLRPSHAHVCRSSKPAAHNTPDARDVGTLPPSTWWASRFCRQSREQTLRPGAFWAREAPAPRLYLAFSRCGCTLARNRHRLWPSCLNGALFSSPHNSPGQGWDTPLLRPTPLSLSSVTKKNICTRLQMSEGPQASHHRRQGGMLAEEGSGLREDLAGLREGLCGS